MKYYSYLTTRDDKEFYSAHRTSYLAVGSNDYSVLLRHSVCCAHLPYASRLHKHSKSIQFAPNCPRTRTSASPAMLLYGKNPNNAFLQRINALMFDAVALTAFIAPIANTYCIYVEQQKAE